MLTEQEREQVKLIVDGVSGRLETKIEGIKELFSEKNENVCKQINEMKTDFTQHDKRVCKLEVSVAKIATKIALFSTLGGLIASIFASIMWG